MEHKLEIYWPLLAELKILDIESSNLNSERDRAELHPEKNKFICAKCKQGSMIPATQEGEPEYTDTFVCIHCGHRATIPSLVIIFSQIISGIMGGIICLYLLIINLSKVLSGIQFGLNNYIISNTVFVLISLVFLCGFGYTFYRAITSMIFRQRYLHKK